MMAVEEDDGNSAVDWQARVADLDARWQLRNTVQVDIINRLMRDGSYEGTMQALAYELAEAQLQRDQWEDRAHTAGWTANLQ